MYVCYVYMNEGLVIYRGFGACVFGIRDDSNTANVERIKYQLKLKLTLVQRVKSLHLLYN